MPVKKSSMAKALGVKPVFVDTLWSSIIPALNLGRFDIIFGGEPIKIRQIIPKVYGPAKYSLLDW